jgi:hypothetical protein
LQIEGVKGAMTVSMTRHDTTGKFMRAHFLITSMTAMNDGCSCSKFLLRHPIHDLCSDMLAIATIGNL